MILFFISLGNTRKVIPINTKAVKTSIKWCWYTVSVETIIKMIHIPAPILKMPCNLFDKTDQYIHAKETCNDGA